MLPPNTPLAGWLRAQRVAAGLTMSDVERSLGLYRGALTPVEHGRHVPRADLLVRLCRLYNVDPAAALPLVA